MDSRWQAADTLGGFEMQLNPNQPFNKITIFEYQDVKHLPDGFSEVRVPRIQQYSIAIFKDGNWQTIYLGDEPMGDCKVINLPLHYTTGKLRFSVLKATAHPSLYELSVIDMPGR